MSGCIGYNESMIIWIVQWTVYNIRKNYKKKRKRKENIFSQYKYRCASNVCLDIKDFLKNALSLLHSFTGFKIMINWRASVLATTGLSIVEALAKIILAGSLLCAITLCVSYILRISTRSILLWYSSIFLAIASLMIFLLAPVIEESTLLLYPTENKEKGWGKSTVKLFMFHYYS